jgi:nucleoside phosphorylase
MKTLIAHDRAEVAEVIKAALGKLEIGESEVQIAEDGVHTRELLRSTLFDLVVLDLTLPHIKGKSQPDYTIVENLLIELFDGDSLNVPGDLIGVTKDKAALDRIDTRIGAHLLAIIEEGATLEWVDRLSDRISFAKKASRSRLLSINQQHDYDVAILTALDPECAPYSDLLELRDLAHYAGAKEFLFQDRLNEIRRGVILSVGRSGQASAASAAQALLTQFRPSLFLMSGFCGGFTGKTEEGDILIAESVFDWDTGKWKGKGEDATFVPRPEPINIRDTKAHHVARQLLQSRLHNHDTVVGKVSELSAGQIKSINFKLGPVASGSAVVSHPAIIKRIEQLNDRMLGVDMEAYGFYYAASSTHVVKPSFLFVKSVADFCDAEKHDRHHDACCYLSANVVLEIIAKRWPF